MKIQVAVRDRMLDEEGTFPQDREEAVKNVGGAVSRSTSINYCMSKNYKIDFLADGDSD